MAFELLENIMDLSIKTYIPEEITKEILVRLPVKSLARFRCVSKPWLFLISSNKFAKEQEKISRKRNNERVIFGSCEIPMNVYDSFIDSLKLPTLYTCSIQSLVHGGYPTTNKNKKLLFDRARVDYYNNYRPFTKQDLMICIVGSCNGLVCLISLPTKTFIVWNPTTGKLRKLPGWGTNSDPQGNRGFVRSYAFGYDELHDDYKVVEFCDAKEIFSGFVPGALDLKVCSLRNNSWKTLSSSNWPTAAGPFFDGHCFGGGMGKFLSGAIHWIVRDIVDDVYKWSIVSHDLATDTFSVSRLPETGDGGGDYFAVSVGVLEGQLALYFECKSHVDVWVMKEYGVYESWTHSFRIPNLLGDCYIHLVPLFYRPEYGEVLIDYGTNFGIFDLNTPRPHQLVEEFFVHGCTTYFESLVSPNLDDELVLGRVDSVCVDLIFVLFFVLFCIFVICKETADR